MKVRPGQLWLNSMGGLTIVIALHEPDMNGRMLWKTLVTFVMNDGSRHTEHAISYPIAFEIAELLSDCPEPEC